MKTTRRKRKALRIAYYAAMIRTLHLCMQLTRLVRMPEGHAQRIYNEDDAAMNNALAALERAGVRPPVLAVGSLPWKIRQPLIPRNLLRAHERRSR